MRLLRVAVGVARQSARDFGGRVKIERSGAEKGVLGLTQWTEAAVRLEPADVSVLFTLAARRGSGSSNSIQVRVGRRLVRPCPEELLQSGDRRSFAEWLRQVLELAIERSSTSDA